MMRAMSITLLVTVRVGASSGSVTASVSRPTVAILRIVLTQMNNQSPNKQ